MDTQSMIPWSCLQPLGNTWQTARREAAWQNGLHMGMGLHFQQGEIKNSLSPSTISLPRQNPNATQHPSSPREFPATSSLRKAPSCLGLPGKTSQSSPACPPARLGGRRDSRLLHRGKDPAGSGTPPHPTLPDSLLRVGEPWAQGCEASQPHPAALRWPAASPRQTGWAPCPQVGPWPLPPAPCPSRATGRGGCQDRAGPLPSPGPVRWLRLWLSLALAPLPPEQLQLRQPRPEAS